jgi:quinol monooxygenase YgiN
MTMIVLAAKFAAKAEHRSEVIRLAAAVAPPSRAEAGCITYNFYEKPGTNECLFFEEWADQAALDLHFQTPHFLQFIKPLAGLIEGAPKIRVYEVGAMRDL